MNKEKLIAFVGTAFLFGLLVTINATFVIPGIVFGDISTSEIDRYSSLTLVGDVMLARNVDKLQTQFGPEYPFKGVTDTPYFMDKIAVVGNFEATIPEVYEQTPPLTFRFSVPATRSEVLRTTGFTHLSLANNHAYDDGAEGFAHTQTVLEGSGIAVFGHPNEVNEIAISHMNVNGVSIALVGINALWNELTEEKLARLVTQLEEATDVQVAYIHWGNEYELQHSRKQREQAEVLVGAGFDFIIGHHPHVVQDIEVINGVPVLYSLGNFIFDQYFSTDVQEGLLVDLSLTRSSYQLKLVPVSSLGTFSQPHIMNEADAVDFLASLAARSQFDVREAVTTGVLTGTLRSR